MISRFSQQVQDQDKIQVSWEEIKKIQESREVWFQDSREDWFHDSREDWFQDSREEIKKTSQGKYWKDFSKKKHSTVLFFKRVFLKIF